ncbi:MAG TPA: citryl-CoA lyase [Bacillota bacterium]
MARDERAGEATSGEATAGPGVGGIAAGPGSGSGEPFISDLAWSTKTDIFVKGHNLADELIGHIDLGGMMFLLLTGRRPSAAEATMTNALLVSLVEHGMTPSAMAARLTYLGAPENLQGAIASGLLGVGSRFVGPVDEVARVLQEALAEAVAAQGLTAAPDPREQPAFYDEAAERIVADFRRQRRIIPGVGHPIHDPEDPRAVRLFALAAELGFAGPHTALQQAIQRAADRAFGKHLPVNVTGAIGAILSDMGFPWRIARGFPIVSRCVGLVAHIREELDRPLARRLWEETEQRTVPPGRA